MMRGRVIDGDRVGNLSGGRLCRQCDDEGRNEIGGWRGMCRRHILLSVLAMRFTQVALRILALMARWAR